MYMYLLTVWSLDQQHQKPTSITIYLTAASGMRSSTMAVPKTSPDTMWWYTARLSTGSPTPTWTVDMAVHFHCSRYLNTLLKCKGSKIILYSHPHMQCYSTLYCRLPYIRNWMRVSKECEIASFLACAIVWRALIWHFFRIRYLELYFARGVC